MTVPWWRCPAYNPGGGIAAAARRSAVRDVLGHRAAAGCDGRHHARCNRDAVPRSRLALFDMQRVYDYLATFTFQRKVSTAGQVSLEGTTLQDPKGYEITRPYSR